MAHEHTLSADINNIIRREHFLLFLNTLTLHYYLRARFYMKYFLLLLVCFFNNFPQPFEPIVGNDVWGPYSRTPYTCTPLHQAVNGDNISHLKELLFQPWAIDCKDSAGDTPLVLAARNKNYRMMNILLNAGASVDEVNLHRVAGHHKPIFAQLLINYGANVNKESLTQYLPLHFAKDSKMTELLLRAGSLVNHKNVYNNAALFEQSQYPSLYKDFLTNYVMHLYYGAHANQKGIKFTHIGEEHILKISNNLQFPIEAAVALIICGAAPVRKTSPGCYELKQWAQAEYLKYSDWDADKPHMKFLHDLIVCPEIICGAEKEYTKEQFKELNISLESVAKIRNAFYIARREFLEIIRDRMGIRPAPRADQPTQQKATNFYIALRNKEIGARAHFERRYKQYTP